MQGTQGAPVFVPYGSTNLKTLGEFRILHTVELIDLHTISYQIIDITQHNGVGIGPDFRDVDGFAQGDAQTFALTDRIKRITFVLTEYIAVYVDEWSTVHFLLKRRYAPFQEPAVVIVRHKTDLVAFSFFRQIGIARIIGHLPHFHFGVWPQGKAASAQGFLTQAPQHVRLVFLIIHPTADEATAVFFLDLGVVAGGNEFTIQGIGPLQQRTPLDVGIAQDTGIGRTPRQVFLDKIIDDVIAKFVPDINNKMVKPHIDRHLPSIIYGVEAAAARFFFGTAGVGIVPGFHGNAYHFVPFLVKHHGGNGTVNPARHGHEHTSVSTHVRCLAQCLQRTPASSTMFCLTTKDKNTDTIVSRQTELYRLRRRSDSPFTHNARMPQMGYRKPTPVCNRTTRSIYLIFDVSKTVTMKVWFRTMCLFAALCTTSTLFGQEYGKASYYANEFDGGRTSFGETYDKDAFTAAHKVHPQGTRLKVTRQDNGKSVVVRVNDRGPYISGRIIELSYAAARQLDMIDEGLVDVKVEVVSKGSLAADEAPAERPNPTARATQTDDTPPANNIATQPSSKTTARGGGGANNSTPSTNPPGLNRAPSGTPPAATDIASEMEDRAPQERLLRGYQDYGLFEVKIYTVRQAGYGVQVGSFSSYENTLKRLAELQGMWFDNLVISVERAGGNKLYKLILGPFESQDKARSYLASLRKNKKGIDGFVVDLSTLSYE